MREHTWEGVVGVDGEGVVGVEGRDGGGECNGDGVSGGVGGRGDGGAWVMAAAWAGCLAGAGLSCLHFLLSCFIFFLISIIFFLALLCRGMMKSTTTRKHTKHGKNGRRRAEMLAYLLGGGVIPDCRSSGSAHPIGASLSSCGVTL